MDGPATSGTLRAFADLPDPRGCNVIHKLHDILVISVCAVICGADGWVDVELYGKSKLSWLSTFLDLPHGIPSHDTFGRVFAKLHPDAFEKCFNDYLEAEFPLRYVPTARECAGTVLYLASDLARVVTGQGISVNGGQWFAA